MGDRDGLRPAAGAELGQHVETCTLAVFSLMNSRRPICRFVSPRATRRITSCSQG